MEASSGASFSGMYFLLDGGGETDAFKLDTSGAVRRLAGCVWDSSWLSGLRERFILNTIGFYVDDQSLEEER